MGNEILREKMNEKRYTGRKLAAEIGMKKSTFASRITGKTEWSIREAMKIAQILDVELSEFLEGER